MIVVIQCAARKQADAGRLVTADGTPIEFVADPKSAPVDPAHVYARPDDLSDQSVSWRRVLLRYNDESHHNPLGLCPAYRLYENATYNRLVDKFGMEKVYILSAGWGLISASFLTPHYDITFSPSAERYKRRRKTDYYDDFCMLPVTIDEEILFVGGKDYLPLFCSLTSTARARKIAFYNSAQVPDARGCSLRRFVTSTRTNWHYECANAILAGEFRIS